MNTGVQRSGATPPAARTATTQAVGAEPGNVFGQGKSAPLIAMAHEIPYVATATVADLRDLEAKVERAMELRGARYLHVLVHLPARLGLRLARHDPDRPARDGDRAVPGLRGRARRGRRRHEDPPARAGRGVPAAAEALRATCSQPERRDDVHRARSRRAPTATSETLRAARDGQAVRDHARRRLEPRQQDRLLAHRAPASTSHRLPPCNDACPAGENIQQWLYHAEEGDYEARLAADHGGQPVPRDHGPGLLPPVRDRLQPRAARRGGRHQLGRALPRRRGDPAGLDRRRSTRRRPASACSSSAPARPGCRPPTTSRRLGHAVTIHDAGPTPAA